jgi:serine/threonine-protein kinase HipA
MNGELVGVWYRNRGGSHLFRYDEQWITSPLARPLSLSLPIVPGNAPYRGRIVDDWFDNLLPDSQAIRDRVRRRFATSSTHAFDLLAAIGRDCVGAAQLVPADTDPGTVHTIDAQKLSESRVAQILRGVTTSRALGIDPEENEFRISIAGAQEKSALLRLNGKWHVPLGATPTTHILKLPLGLVANIKADMHDSIENEWLCTHFLQELGLPVANTEIAVFHDKVGSEKALVVERFDRQFERSSSGIRWISRLPQEDLCQAKGIPAHKKYESDGGPGITSVLELLAAGEAPDYDSLTFAKAQLAFWLLAAPDGHAKNFSIFLRRDGYRLTPLYDVISAWPIIGHGPNLLPYEGVKLSMALRGSRPYYHINRIPIRQWRRLALQTRVDGAFDELVQLADAAAGALARLESALPPGFPEHVWRTVTQGIAKHRQLFLDSSAATNTPGTRRTRRLTAEIRA